MKDKAWLGLVLAVASAPVDAGAQSWPARQIEMIIPYAAGGGVDIIFARSPPQCRSISVRT